MRARLTVGELATLGERGLGGATPSPLLERAVADLVAERVAEALEAAADEAERQWMQQTLMGPVFVTHRTSRWLRARAATLRGDA